MKSIKINNFEISNDNPFTLIVGPCVIENRDHALTMAENIKNICEETNTNFFTSTFSAFNMISSKFSLNEGWVKLHAMSMNSAIFIFYQLQYSNYLSI